MKKRSYVKPRIVGSANVHPC
ncbi:hypothetical protein GSU2897 [Geobacter sulfurreducens PCA]|uniref:Uncharacterized protein n=2 Tax=Geobacter TaxID=28231 RepID=J9JEM4_GEOMG|nr:hypothetical protein GSU2897 [Geobacter sulfurreducens PCA]ADN78400.1 hypothetical protein KN400_3511 [Geobacter sulfurreducens KN400]AFR42801.1 hypothetical protein Gmet_3649 [Geobacter metallireducens GS-15]